MGHTTQVEALKWCSKSIHHSKRTRWAKKMDTVGSAGGDPLRTLPRPKSNRNRTPLLFKESSPPLCREPLEPFSLSWSSCPWDLWPSQIQTQTTMTTTTTTTIVQNFQLGRNRSLLPITLQIQQGPQIEYQQ